MVVFGGGNEGIVDELHVYNTGKSFQIFDIWLKNWESMIWFVFVWFCFEFWFEIV
jgi:hypothetical protein